MGEFFKYDKGASIEHYCGDELVPDPTNEPHQKCSICGRPWLLQGEVFEEAAKIVEAEKEENLIETYEVDIPVARKPGEDWDGTWENWGSGKGRTSWSSYKRATAAIRTAAHPPEEYRVIKVFTRPEIVVKREVLEEKGVETYAEYRTIDSSRAWADEGERPVSDLDSEDQMAENDRSRTSDVPSIADYNSEDGENMTTRFRENFRIHTYTPKDGDDT